MMFFICVLWYIDSRTGCVQRGLHCMAMWSRCIRYPGTEVQCSGTALYPLTLSSYPLIPDPLFSPCLPFSLYIYILPSFISLTSSSLSLSLSLFQSILFMHENYASAGLENKLKTLASQRKLENLTIGPVLTWSTEQIMVSPSWITLNSAFGSLALYTWAVRMLNVLINSYWVRFINAFKCQWIRLYSRCYERGFCTLLYHCSEHCSQLNSFMCVLCGFVVVVIIAKFRN